MLTPVQPGCVRQSEEGWVQCDQCERWVHQICGLFNKGRNTQDTHYMCPMCLQKGAGPSLVFRAPQGLGCLQRLTGGNLERRPVWGCPASSSLQSGSSMLCTCCVISQRCPAAPVSTTTVVAHHLTASSPPWQVAKVAFQHQTSAPCLPAHCWPGVALPRDLQARQGLVLDCHVACFVRQGGGVRYPDPPPQGIPRLLMPPHVNELSAILCRPGKWDQAADRCAAPEHAGRAGLAHL